MASAYLLSVAVLPSLPWKEGCYLFTTHILMQWAESAQTEQVRCCGTCLEPQSTASVAVAAGLELHTVAWTHASERSQCLRRPFGQGDTAETWDSIIYLFIYFVTLGTQSPKVLNISIEIHVWNGHGAASEIVNDSAKQTDLNLCTAADNLWKRTEVSRGSFAVSDIFLITSNMNSNPVLHIECKVSKSNWEKEVCVF